MLLVVPKETKAGEKRVAATPSTLNKLIKLGFEIHIEKDAGLLSLYPDSEYEKNGAKIVSDIASSIKNADVIASVSSLNSNLAKNLKPGAICISFAQAKRDKENIREIMNAKATLLSFDFVPRISRAQSADALTSQATVSGYHTMVTAASLLPKMFPLVMTASGTIRPSKVLVIGAGVAGLQVMATAKKLGAIVSGYDVRTASKDEVKSVGATFIELDLPVVEGSGGYAKEMDQERTKLQQELLTPHITATDVLITTAAVPGRPAPRLVTSKMLAGMKPGSVIADMAAENGGNVEGSVAGQVIEVNGVKIWGGQNIASEMAPDASFLYSGNVISLLSFLVKESKIVLDKNDEVISGSALIIDGQITNEFVKTEMTQG
ncbi:MAG: NAD(P) transhydrogenase subunit alpha [Actinomycetes bacterium]|jgi:NAD(P) transhydrogenase subunit alpha